MSLDNLTNKVQISSLNESLDDDNMDISSLINSLRLSSTKSEIGTKPISQANREFDKDEFVHSEPGTSKDAQNQTNRESQKELSIRERNIESLQNREQTVVNSSTKKFPENFESSNVTFGEGRRSTFTLRDVEDSLVTFNGEDEQNIVAWISEFELVANVMQWDEMQCSFL